MQVHFTTSYAAGAYVTSTVCGQRASSTMSGIDAAQRLGERLFRGMPFTLQFDLDPAKTGPMPCRVSGDEAVAWCWRTGLIEVGLQVPDGGLELCRGLPCDLHDAMDVLARHGQGQSAGRLLVPGLPEATGDEDACDAVQAFLHFAQQGHRRRRAPFSRLRWYGPGVPAAPDAERKRLEHHLAAHEATHEAAR